MFRFYQAYRQFILALAWFEGRREWPDAKVREIERLGQELDRAYVSAGKPNMRRGV